MLSVLGQKNNCGKVATMINQRRKSKIFSWVFFILSVGALISGGIYIEKVVLTAASNLDILRAVLFCIFGAVLSAYSFFGNERGE